MNIPVCKMCGARPADANMHRYHVEVRGLKVMDAGSMFKWVWLCDECAARLDNILTGELGEFYYWSPRFRENELTTQERTRRNRAIRDRATAAYLNMDLLKSDDIPRATVEELVKTKNRSAA